MGAEESFKRILQRERAARKEAERLLEEKSLALYSANQSLLKINQNLENKVEERTRDLKEKERNLSYIFEENPDAIAVVKISDNQVLACNSKFLNLFLNDENKKIKKKILNLIIKIYKNKNTSNHQTLILKKNIRLKGIKKQFRIRINSIVYDNNQSLHLGFEDVTEQAIIKNEKEILARRYKQLIENVSDLIYTVNFTDHISFVSPALSKITNIEIKELLGNTLTPFIHPSYREKYIDVMMEVREKKEDLYFEFPLKLDNDIIVWLGQTTSVLNDESEELICVARNISERRENELRIQKSEEKFRTIIENMNLGFVEMNVDGCILNVYDSFCNLSGYSKKELIGKELNDFLIVNQTLNPENNKILKLLNREDKILELKLRRKNGSTVWVILSISPYYSITGRVQGNVGIFLDITNRKKTENELNKAKEHAEYSVQMKQDFMANLSHEIRTPINAIIGLSEILEETKLDELQYQYVDAILKSSSNLQILLNDLLDLSKIESGKLEFNIVTNSLKELLTEIESTYLIQFQEKNIDFIIKNEVGIDCFKFDKLRLFQVLLNLVSNSYKFTHSGYVKILIQQQKEFDDDIELLFIVEDTGIGIEQNKLELIFDSFNQATISTAQNYGGTGLGLSITKKLVEMMNGTLEVTSKPGVGTRFNFTCTFKKSDNFKEINPSQIDESIFIGKKVLVAEDNKFNQLVIKTFLENWKFDVVIVENGKLAIEQTISNKFDLILMDIQMPVMDGVEATKILIRQNNFKTPIIALTANALKENHQKYINIGMTDFLPKPYKKEEIKKILYDYLKY